jgi:hypothetical protein
MKALEVAGADGISTDTSSRGRSGDRNLLFEGGRE